MPAKNTRAFIRHAADVPIHVHTIAGNGRVQKAVNVSTGGLAFESEECLDPGSTVDLRIDQVAPPFEAKALVAWCRPEADHYLVGVSFLDASDAFRSRMVQQVCSIENYRKEAALNEGRELTPQEAAMEWIKKYGRDFPG
jgi:hypothetical protein